jgi:hypothetical protein
MHDFNVVNVLIEREFILKISFLQSSSKAEFVEQFLYQISWGENKYSFLAEEKVFNLRLDDATTEILACFCYFLFFGLQQMNCCFGYSNVLKKTFRFGGYCIWLGKCNSSWQLCYPSL